MASYENLPDFDSLPKVEGMPKGCAWGIFDKDGKKDVLGTINLLTPDVVKAAASEIKEGVSISLNWPMGAHHTPRRDPRTRFSHKVSKSELAPHIMIDEVTFDTQISSQWDSLYWHERGGLVGRGVLIDYKAWADRQGITWDYFGPHRITTKEIETIAKEQRVEFKQGDIIIIRTGYTEEMSKLTPQQQVDGMLASTGTCGVEGTEEAAAWFWNHHFAAVACDAVGFEAMHPIIDGKEVSNANLVLHQYFLSLFGLPIGELWDLKALSDKCAASKRWTFLLTSAPLNTPGLVGSPPNALAIF